jgi:hypothetical protein
MAKAPEVEKKKLPTHFRSDMPQAFAAAGRIIQILTAMSLQDAEKALGVVNGMFADRKADVANPPHNPE